MPAWATRAEEVAMDVSLGGDDDVFSGETFTRG
jgi:hypothetical protein